MTAPSRVAPLTTMDGFSNALAIENCPLCDDFRSTQFHRFTVLNASHAGDFELRKCRNCELIYVNPRLSNEDLSKLYDEDFYFSTGGSCETLASWVIELIQTRRRRRVERYGPPGHLLDIGSGDGSFVHHMARHGWSATGIDFSPAAVELSGRFSSGARFLRGSLEDHDFPARGLDLVTLWQVLEHIGEPRQLLRSCHRLLRPGGMFVAAVPNIDGLSSRLTGERWWGLDVPRHQIHYTPVTLRRSLEAAGFRVVHIRHHSLQYDPYALLHSSLDWVFSRRHFLSDLAKRQVPMDMGGYEYARNLAALVAFAPLLAPLSIAATTAGSCFGYGGFIEVHARRE